MDPKFKLRLWLYASLRGTHAASQVSPQDLAVDSMRLEADASSASIRTLERSTKRLVSGGAPELDVPAVRLRAQAG